MKRKVLNIITVIGLSCTSAMFAESIVNAEDKAEMKIADNTSNSKETSRDGLMGYYYENASFTKPIVVSPTSKENLGFGQTDLVPTNQEFQSIRWMGYIFSDSTKDVELKLSNAGIIKIKVNGQEQNNTIHLEKNNPLSVQIEYVATNKITLKDLLSLQLLLVDKKENKLTSSNYQFKNPQFGNEDWENTIAIASKNNLYSLKSDEEVDIDTDGDNIYDKWEVEGYTIQNKVAVAWKDEFKEKGYTKFVSNPLEAHTAGDPYNDYEKAARDVPLVNGKETFNPLVAAFPSVNVNLEKIVISKNEDLSHSVGSNHSTNWSYSNTVGVDMNESISLFGPSFAVSGHYQHSSNSAEEWGGSNEDTSHLNGAESAYLNANVRYNNVGSGAIYNVRPTTSFVLDETTIGTIKAKDNTEALSISPKESYPKKGNNGIAINTMDDFNSRPIYLNKNQLESYLSNKAPILLETDQVDGKYASKDVHGNIVIEGNWNGVEQQIKSRTASIMIDSGDTMLERRVAAKDYSDPEDRTPELTLKEALKIAFSEEITEENGLLKYNGVPIEEHSVLSFIDEATSKMVKKQLADSNGEFKDVKNLYDVKLEPKMNLTIKQALFYDDGESKNSVLGDWNNSVDHEVNSENSNSGSGSYHVYSERHSNSEAIKLRLNEKVKKKLNKNSKYYITASIKEDSKYPIGMDKAVVLRAFDEFSEIGVGYIRQSVSSKGFRRITVAVDGLGKQDVLGGLNIALMSVGAPNLPEKEAIYIDDISITEVGTRN